MDSEEAKASRQPKVDEMHCKGRTARGEDVAGEAATGVSKVGGGSLGLGGLED